MPSRPLPRRSSTGGPTHGSGPHGPSGPGVVRGGILATVLTLVLVAVVYLVADASTEGLVVEMPGAGDIQEIGYSDTIVPTVLGGIVGALLAWAAGPIVGGHARLLPARRLQARS